MVVFSGRGTVVSIEEQARPSIPSLKPDTYEQARRAAPGWDVHILEQEWRAWASEIPQSADAAFIGFCKRRHSASGPR